MEFTKYGPLFSAPSIAEHEFLYKTELSFLEKRKKSCHVANQADSMTSNAQFVTTQIHENKL